jgi:hypothetical protein
LKKARRKQLEKWCSYTLGLGAFRSFGSPWQKAFITIVIFAVPLVAMMMLWTRARKIGVILLGLSFAGSLLFGASYHFLIAGPDNALGNYRSHWGSVFRDTAIVLTLLEAAGLALCVFVLPAKPPDATASRASR